jgi:hypothetical protein
LEAVHELGHARYFADIEVTRHNISMTSEPPRENLKLGDMF